jgi:nitric oxide synthase-interacting protein
MLKDWGTVKQRLGADSIKTFDSCNICLSQAVDPQVCDRGHLFCKECILTNLLEQRKAKKRQMQRWQTAQATRVQEEAVKEEVKGAERLAAFEKAEGSVPDGTSWSRFEEERKFGKLSHEQAVQLRAKESIISAREHPDKTALKASLAKTCFWVPELTPAVEEVAMKPSKLLLCPAENSKTHCIKLSSLTPVHATVLDGKYSCDSCKLTLTHQASGVLKACSHLLCMNCIKLYCLPSESCVLCGVPVTKVVSMQSGGTSYSAHNEVTAKVVKPVFNC